MSEKLELVTDFAALRAGMIVAVDCRHCGQRVRGLLVCREHGTTYDLTGHLIRESRWRMAPEHVRELGGLTPSETTVKERRVFRVVDGLESSTETRQRNTVRA